MKPSFPTLAPTETCSGCTACKAICPKDAIAMRPDHEGFLRPQVDAAVCVGCHRCEQVCPVLHPGRPDPAPTCYAAYTKNESLRLKSSSGGIFTELAKPVIAAGGVVFGCVWERPELVAVHAKAETMDELAEMRGSKYVQSDLRETFREAKAALKAGRQVLFSGTPCQIAGLSAFLGEPYKNLLMVEIICHGVPSPLVFERYKSELTRTVGEPLTEIRFKVKTDGGTWMNPHMVVNTRRGACVDEPLYGNVYASAYFHHLCLRPSCHSCQAREGRSGADITIGDFWGYTSKILDSTDSLGMSVVFLHTSRAVSVLWAISNCMILKQIVLRDAVRRNSPYLQSVAVHRNRELFMSCLLKKRSLKRLLNQCLRGPWLLWMVRRAFSKCARMVSQ